VVQLFLNPQAAVSDHTATAPGNQQQFSATTREVDQAGCNAVLPQFIAVVHPIWTVSDPLHVTVSSADDATNGLATCLGATNGAAMLTAAFGSGTNQTTATASILCK
jgi:hypothetical protein